MINVTERAKVELKKLLDTSVDWPGARLRLLERKSGSLGLGVDIDHKDDEFVEYEGQKLLIVDNSLATRLDCITLDVDDTPEGVELIICEKSKV
jgi:hypothetical protein